MRGRGGHLGSAHALPPRALPASRCFSAHVSRRLAAALASSAAFLARLLASSSATDTAAQNTAQTSMGNTPSAYRPWPAGLFHERCPRVWPALTPFPGMHLSGELCRRMWKCRCPEQDKYSIHRRCHALFLARHRDPDGVPDTLMQNGLAV